MTIKESIQKTPLFVKNMLNYYLVIQSTVTKKEVVRHLYTTRNQTFKTNYHENVRQQSNYFENKRIEKLRMEP